MTPQEQLRMQNREQRRQLDEFKEVFNKQQRERRLQEQRDLQIQGNGQLYSHYRDEMDHWHMHHGHQASQNQNNFNQRDYDQLASLPSANICQLPLGQGHENIYHDTPAVGVPRAGPRPSLQPDPWLRTSYPRQVPQTPTEHSLPSANICQLPLGQGHENIHHDTPGNRTVQVTLSALRKQNSIPSQLQGSQSGLGLAI